MFIREVNNQITLNVNFECLFVVTISNVKFALLIVYCVQNVLPHKHDSCVI